MFRFRYTLSHRTIMRKETLYSSYMINFSVFQTLNIIQSDEVLYFHSISRFYSTQIIMETVNWKVALEWITAEELTIYCPKILSHKWLNLTTLLLYLCITFTIFFYQHFVETENIFEKATMMLTMWLPSQNHKKSLTITLWLLCWLERHKKWWRQQKKCCTQMYF